MALQVGEKFLTIKLGDLKFAAFPAKTKEGKTYYKADIRIWVNEKQEPQKIIQKTESVL